MEEVVTDVKRKGDQYIYNSRHFVPLNYPSQHNESSQKSVAKAKKSKEKRPVSGAKAPVETSPTLKKILKVSQNTTEPAASSIERKTFNISFAGEHQETANVKKNEYASVETAPLDSIQANENGLLAVRRSTEIEMQE